jgi:hypothetical protein
MAARVGALPAMGRRRFIGPDSSARESRDAQSGRSIYL